MINIIEKYISLMAKFLNLMLKLVTLASPFFPFRIINSLLNGSKTSPKNIISVNFGVIVF